MVAKKDWTGQKFNRLTLLEPTDKRHKINRHIIWRAVCDCRNDQVFVRPSHVKTGWIKSCGCLPVELAIELSRKKRKFTPLISSARRIYTGHYADGDIDFDTFFLLSQESCYYCGRSPHRTYNVGIGRRKKKTPLQGGDFTYNGLDRINPNRGHYKNNVVTCCFDCNYMKSDKTPKEFQAHLNRMHNYRLAHDLQDVGSCSSEYIQAYILTYC